MKVTKNLFGKVMRIQRILMHLTHQQLADALGISKKIIVNMEKGISRSTADNESKIIALLFRTMNEYYKACTEENDRLTATIKINYPHYSELNGTENE